MKISDVINILKAEKNLERTPIGRPLDKIAIDNLNAALSDKNNYDQEVVKCQNCGLITSSLLVPNGCNGCNSKDLTSEINKNEIM